MPELPEVETVARQLSPRLLGRTVTRFTIRDELLRSEAVPALRGRRIVRVGRSGKQVAFGFSTGRRRRPELWLLIHLRMTGRLLYLADTRATKLPHLRADWALDRGRLVFIDTRRFGTFRWLRSLDESRPCGVDPTAPEFTPRRLEELIRSSRQPLKPWLLRQDRLVGLGNIYASEIPHSARLSPFRAVGSLDDRELRRLHAATRRVLERAIRHCGTTFSDFQDARGIDGSYQRFLKVYGREKGRCRRCGTRIVKTVQQQRSTFHCPGCQR